MKNICFCLRIRGTASPEFISGKQSFQVEVYDLFGKEVFYTELVENQQTIDISSIKAGVYLYKITNNKEIVKSGKLIKINN